MNTESSDTITALAEGPPDGRGYVGPSEVLETLLRRRRFLVGTVGAIMVASLVVLFLLPESFTAGALLAAEEQQSVLPAQFAGLASMAGISLGATTEGPQFYAAILRSRPIMDAVLKKSYPVGGADSVGLIEILKPRGETEEERLWNANRLLGRRLATEADLRTGMISLAVTLPSPITAAAVANSFIDELNRFNAEVRQSQARVRREFIEARVAEVAGELMRAEEAVRQFLLENRDFENSPRLTFEYGRLQRAMTTQQELYLDLERQLNTARIEEVDDIPAVTIIEAAVPPHRKSRPRRGVWLAIITFASTALLSGYVVLREHGRAVFGLTSVGGKPA